MDAEQACQLFLGLGPKPLHDAIQLPVPFRMVLPVHDEEGGVEAGEEDWVEPRGVQLTLPPGGNVVGYGPPHQLVSRHGGQHADASSGGRVGGVIARDNFRTVFPETQWQQD